jgi:hypothetical protein
MGFRKGEVCQHPSDTQYNAGAYYLNFKPYERFAQLAFVPVLRVGFDEVSEFHEVSDRGDGGFGSRRANEVAHRTLTEVRRAIGVDYFGN